MVLTEENKARGLEISREYSLLVLCLALPCFISCLSLSHIITNSSIPLTCDATHFCLPQYVHGSSRKIKFLSVEWVTLQGPVHQKTTNALQRAGILNWFSVWADLELKIQNVQEERGMKQVIINNNYRWASIKHYNRLNEIYTPPYTYGFV